jgi:peptide/nickel transport system ATP-binding protein
MLEIRNLVVDYGNFRALNQLSFDFAAEATEGSPLKIALVGQSGSGKTSLAQAILGLLPDYARVQGSIQWQGRELLGLNDKTISSVRGYEIALIPQDPLANLTPVFRIGKQWRLANRRRLLESNGPNQSGPSDDNAIRDGLGAFVKRYPNQISGGQRQQVLIELALAKRPQLVIADEVTTGLDTDSAEQALQVLADFPVLLITHDLAIAQRFCSRIVILRSGQIVEIIDSQAVASARDPYSQEILTALAPVPRRKFIEGDTEVNPARLKVWSPPAQSIGGNRNAPVLVRANQLSFSYRQRPVFSNLSFEIMAGQTTVLVGATGSGKTTVAHILAGLIKPSSGTVVWADPSFPNSQRVQMVFQNPASTFDPRYNVEQSLYEAMLLSHQATPEFAELDYRRRRMEQVLTQVDLNPLLQTRKISALSGGEVQRVALARVLLFSPQLIILDESLVGLDPITSNRIVTLLKDIQRSSGIAYLFISHNPALVHAMLS